MHDRDVKMTVPIFIAFGPMLAMEDINNLSNGSVFALFFNKTIPCLDAFSANSRFASVQTSFGPNFDHGVAAGSSLINAPHEWMDRNKWVGT